MRLAKNFLIKLLTLSTSKRRLILTCIDAVLLPLAVWSTHLLRHTNQLEFNFESYFWLIPSSIFIGIFLYALTNQYKGLTRYVGSTALYKLAIRNIFLVFSLAIYGFVIRKPLPPIGYWIILWLIINIFVGSLRFAFRDILFKLLPNPKDKTSIPSVAIYGAGAAGAHLATSLKLAKSHNIRIFLDDDPQLWNRTLNDIPIRKPKQIEQFKNNLDYILIAIPSLGRNRRREIFESLQCHNIPLLQVPSIEDLTTGIAQINTLKRIPIEDLLGRNSISPIPELLGPGIEGKIVCVTGAGGSIGSDLSRQILKLKPKKLILLDHSEPSLYSIHQRLITKSSQEEKVLKPVLGSACNSSLINKVIVDNQVEIIFHAAAYKHVPLVEENPLEGLLNNVFSTLTICKFAESLNVEKVVLISTDKAVRPTNIMGASKRLSELIFQAFAEINNSHKNQKSIKSTCFTMVRFGNVLDSSGSVVPLFRKQIKNRGPITLTHPNIIRYFMTISEATELVLQAAMLADGGDIFLLDMGKPVSIISLAKQMIRLSGLSIKDTNNPNGDIEIKIVGLRPGEKLFEELLIDSKSTPTKHPLIFKAVEHHLSIDILWPKLEQLKFALSSQDEEKSLKLLSELVPEWEREKTN